MTERDTALMLAGIAEWKREQREGRARTIEERPKDDVRELFWHAVTVACDELAVPRADLMGSARYQKVASARRIVVGLMDRRVKVSLPFMGEMLSVHHSTVMYSRSQFAQAMAEDAAFRAVFATVDHALDRRLGVSRKAEVAA